MTNVHINLTAVHMGGAGIHGWAGKADAVAVLAKLRERGLNAERCEQFHRAHNRFFRFWIIARPDPLIEFFWIMGKDGHWSRGRLYDEPPTGGGATWVPMPTPEPIPPTFTHVTSTVPHAYARTERYKTKSNGSCGRWVRSDDSVARCTCGWKSYTATRAEAQAAARVHRDNPGDHPLRSLRPPPS